MTPVAKHGRLDGPKKSAYSFEKWDFNWELEYMEELESDALVDAWTKNHGIRIPYIDSKSHKREYRPDFVVRLIDGGLELHEVKGGHLLDSDNTQRKFEAAQRWCAEREMKFEVVTK